MKLTRKKLRQLINEALKPFFYGVPPTDIIQRLINDPDVDDQAKMLLNHPDLEMQRTGMSLIQDPEILEKYPELADFDIASPELAPDLTDRSQPAYKSAFDSAQQRAKDLETKMAIIQKVDDAEQKIANLLHPYRSQLPDLHVDSAPYWGGYMVSIYTSNLPILEQIEAAAKAMRLNPGFGINFNSRTGQHDLIIWFGDRNTASGKRYGYRR